MSSSSTTKICFNSICNDVLPRLRRGWRRRTGEFAELCDRCASAYEEGKFCETFHLSASGWRCCESCGKQIHCGCIVSFHLFVLLDAGGIECITCARKSFILTPNPAWPPPSLFLPVQHERIKDLSVKSWSHIAGSGPVPWRQAPSLFSSTSQSELHRRMPFEVDISTGVDRVINSEHLAAVPLEKKRLTDFSDRLLNGALKLRATESHDKGKAGVGIEEQPNPSVNVFQKSPFMKNDASTPHNGLATPSVSPYEANDQTKFFGGHTTLTTPAVKKEFDGHYGFDSSSEAQIRNGKLRGDTRSKNQLLSRYSPRVTEQELQQISGDPNFVVTPLFEKMLSASDAGRIGRLVLPKKCAEAYFPPISQPEGLPLKVQDLKGKEWVFQFRFWPNNNSRMYVLEGVTPCIQSMQLQAGDIVTFSRIGPEGKLVMGFRKASNAPSFDKGNETENASNGVSIHGDAKKTKSSEVVSAAVVGNSLPLNMPSASQANSMEPGSPDAKDDKSAFIAGDKSSFRIKRKNNTLGSKSKRQKIENKDPIELKLTWEEAQGLLRPPPNHVPTVVIVEGLEFEEYEQDAPIIGRPTIFLKDLSGENVQWAQCEECLKWRKIPIDALLPSRWTCTENFWDPQRSLCSAAQELVTEQLEELLSRSSRAASKKIKAAKQDPDSLEVLKGLDALANLAILEEGEALIAWSQETTKHPRHRPGCTCIVCIQPPSGKGPRHKQTCACSVCLTVKRRFRTLTLRREKNKSEREAETAQKKPQNPYIQDKLTDEDPQLYTDSEDSGPDHKGLNHEHLDDEFSKMNCYFSPLKGQIDLNMQPERDEELSPSLDFGNLIKPTQDVPDGSPKLWFSSSVNNGNVTDNQEQVVGVGAFGNLRNGVVFGNSHQESGTQRFGTLPVNASASTSTVHR